MNLYGEGLDASRLVRVAETRGQALDNSENEVLKMRTSSRDRLIAPPSYLCERDDKLLAARGRILAQRRE